MADVPNPYFIYLELYWPNGNRVTKNEIARVRAYDVNGGVETSESECGYDEATGGWMPAYMQNIGVFFARGKPNLKFIVTSVGEVNLHTTQVFEEIASGSTVHIVVGETDYLTGGATDWTIWGLVRDASGASVTEGTVVVYDVTQEVERPLRTIKLGASGSYTAIFSLSDFSDNGVYHTLPNVLVRVFDNSGDRIGESILQTSMPVGRHQIDLDAETGATDGELRVYGNIRNKLSLPVSGIKVDVRHLAWTTTGLVERSLATKSDDGVGNYEVYYHRPILTEESSPCGTPAGQINLVVYALGNVTGTTDFGQTLAKSDVIFDASDDQRVDFVVDRPASTTASEYTLLHDSIDSCLKGKNADNSASIAKLSSNPQYVSFVAKSTGVDEGQLQAYVNAWVIAGQINEKVKPLPSNVAMKAEVIYGLIRMGLGESLTALLEVRPESFFTALVDAIHQGIISLSIEGRLTPPSGKSLLEDWQAVLSAYLANEDGNSGKQRWQTLLLNLVFPWSVNAGKRKHVTEEYFKFSGDFSSFCAYLGQLTVTTDDGVVKVFTEKEPEYLKFAFELYEACDHYFGIVQAVYADLVPRKWTTIKDLATVQLENQIVNGAVVKGWVGYSQTAFDNATGVYTFPANVPGSTEKDASGFCEKTRIYGKRLFDKFAGVSSEGYFKTGLASDTSTGSSVINNFLKDNASFSLETSNIEKFIVDNPSVALTTDQVKQLKQLQRVYRLTSDYATAKALIANGLDSAVVIAKTHEDEFVVKYEQALGGIAKARKIHQVASHYASEVLFALVKYHQHLNATGGATALTAAINLANVTAVATSTSESSGTAIVVNPTEGYNADYAKPTDATKTPPIDRFPNWITLFGDLNKCACKECQTVFGPGAYLVDLLEFVQKYFGDEVLKRRSDLADIEITCPNTNVAVPYIDLVNEVLEDAVLRSRGESTTFNMTSSGLSATTVGLLLNASLEGKEADISLLRTIVSETGGYLLSDQVRVLKAAGYHATNNPVWTIEDDAIRFNVKQSNNNVFSTPIAQTSGTNDSVEVFPEHTIAAVYDKVLSKEVFPFNLPIAVGREETEIFLERRSVRRHEIIEAFSTLKPFEKWPTPASALAFLELTEGEANAVLGLDSVTPGTPLPGWRLWGFDNETGNHICRPDKPTVELNANHWVELMTLVPVFLHRSGLSYAELIDLLEQEFIHAEVGAGVVLHIANNPNPKALTDTIECNYNSFQLAHLNENTLRRMSLFIRLWRKLGWTMKEIDRCLVALYGENRPADLVGVALVKRLCEELGVEPLTALAWVSPMDTYRTRHVRESLFDAVYLHGSKGQREFEKLAELALDTTGAANFQVPAWGEGNDPAVATITVDYPAYLRGGLKLDAASMSLLWEKTVGRPTLNTDGTPRTQSLSLLQLSEMYRIASFCEAVSLTVEEYFDLIDVIGSPLFSALSTSTVTTSALVDILVGAGNIEIFKRSKLSLDEALYFLRDKDDTASLSPSSDAVGAAMARISPLTTALYETYPLVAKPDAELLGTNLGKMMPADKVARLIQVLVVNGDGSQSLPTMPVATTDPNYQNYVFLSRYLSPLGSAVTKATSYATYQEFLAALCAAVTTDARYALLWTVLRAHLVEQYLTANVYPVITEVFGIEQDVAEHLLSHPAALREINGTKPAIEDWKAALLGGWKRTTEQASGLATATTTLVVPRDGTYAFTLDFANVTGDFGADVRLGELVPIPKLRGAGTNVIIEFVPTAFKAGTPLSVTIVGMAPAWTFSLRWQEGNADAASVPEGSLVPLSLVAFEKVHRAVGFMRALGITKEELFYLLNAVNVSGGERSVFDKLPGLAFGNFASVVNVLELNRTVTLKDTSLFSFWLLSEFKTDNATTEIAAYTGWRAADVEFISGLWNAIGRPAWNDPEYWYVLTAVMDVVKRLKMRASQVHKLLVSASPTVRTAEALRNLYRAEYDKNSWKDAFKPLSDKLRQRKRDALVGYLTRGTVTWGTDKRRFFDANDLFGYFLIDVEMEPDTLISRIRLALNVIQLYVARVFWGLEVDRLKVEPTEVKEKWEWMQNYRVWEANRKVFLYPENWIEPELRDDKTPFFKELEDELLQKDSSDENGRIALSNYLEKLNEVSDLEIIGATRQDVNANGISYILHVIGRTRSRTRNYFYRTFQGKQFYDGQWTPWVRVNLDIKGEVALPCVFNGRLFLVWAMIKVKQKSKSVDESTVVSESNLALSRAEYRADIQLMWSEYASAENKWLKSCLSKKAIKDDALTLPSTLEESPEQIPPDCYHLRIDENGNESFAVAVIKTEIPGANGTLSPRILGRFRVWTNGQDTVEWGGSSITLTSNWPVATLLKSNMAEETGLTIDSEQPSDAFKFKGTTAFFRRTPEYYRVFQTNFNYVDTDNDPFFYITDTKSFFGLNRGRVYQGGLSKEQTKRIKLQTFSHPHTRTLQELLQTNGPSAIMCRTTEAMPSSQNYYYNYSNSRSNYYYNYYGSMLLGYYIAGDNLAKWNMERKFEIEYQPNTQCFERFYPRPTIEFGYGTPFGAYNWELFFHVPMLIAERLSQDMKFEEAMKWFHCVFDPKQELTTYERTKRWVNDLPPGCRYWNFLPFFANPDATESLLETMGFLDEPDSSERQQLAAIIDEWKRNPFNPHLIARSRIVAYQKNVVMKYLDNLIAWGDHLFRQDTFEAINLATQLYVLADQLLGKRPETVEPLVREARYTYRELSTRGIDEFSNSIAEVEYHILSNRQDLKEQNTGGIGSGGESFQRLTIQTLYFALPRNERLDRYWDTVADRLFKIRNSMNIEGVKRALALYEPPIDPALLVRAAAAGLNLSDVLADENAPLPHYRFNIWMQKAIDLGNELKGFGAAILSAVEKKDAEALQRLRQGHEIRMLKLAYKVREQQIEEANANITALEYSKKITEERQTYYRKIEEVSRREQLQLTLTDVATGIDTAQGLAHMMSGLFAPIPDSGVGACGIMPLFTAEIKIGHALSMGAVATANLLGATSTVVKGIATHAGIKAGYERRWADWKLQERLANKEIEQIEKQLIAAEIRLAIAEKELENQEKQIEQAEEVREFLETKFTSTELYRWMVTELSKSFQDVYKLAYKVARTAERTLQFELGLDGNTRYLQTSYLDGLRQNLLVGEHFLSDLKRMDIAYLERNKREYELQKSISLATINAKALQALREDGVCTFELPELLFDLDHPGQYFRRIKSVRLTIPCVTGPHTNVSAKLSLTRSAIRKETTIGDAYEYKGMEDTRFEHRRTGNRSIATSTAQSDSGLFELNFRDERYLPFEGEGVVSSWRLELPETVRQFDYDTISDVVVHISYTARDGSPLLKEEAVKDVTVKLNHLLKMVAESGANPVRVISLKKEFPDELHQLLSSAEGTSLVLGSEHFPYLLRSLGKEIALSEASIPVSVVIKPGATFGGGEVSIDGKVSVDGKGTTLGNKTAGEDLKSRIVVPADNVACGSTTIFRNWTLKLTSPTIGVVEDVILVLAYTVDTEA